MKYQLLVSAMYQKDYSLIDKMRINSDAIIINQSNENKFESFSHCNNKIDIYTFNERGVGLSRNTALMRSAAEIIEFADDDMIFEDDYEKIVVDEFDNHPEADAIVFSINSLNTDRPSHKIDSFKRVGRIESRKYGCARLAVRREKIIANNISFSLLFGPGARYGCGEDTLILKSILDSGLKLYKSPAKIANVKQESSTWFEGYTDQYYIDKGALMCALYPHVSRFAALLMAIKHSQGTVKNFNNIFKLYLIGIKEFERIK